MKIIKHRAFEALKRPLSFVLAVTGVMLLAGAGAGVSGAWAHDIGDTKKKPGSSVTVDMSALGESTSGYAGASGYGGAPLPGSERLRLLMPGASSPRSQFHAGPVGSSGRAVKLKAVKTRVKPKTVKTRVKPKAAPKLVRQSSPPAPVVASAAKPAAKPAPVPSAVPPKPVTPAPPPPAAATRLIPEQEMAVTAPIEPSKPEVAEASPPPALTPPAPPPVTPAPAESKEMEPVVAAPPPPPPPTPEPPTAAEKPAAPAPTEKASLTPSSTIEPGRAMRVEFDSAASKVPAGATDQLKELAAGLKENTKLRVQLMAYAGGESLSAGKARRLSLSRALSVRSFLIENDIRSTRIDVRALGNKTTEKPLNRVDINITER